MRTPRLLLVLAAALVLAPSATVLAHGGWPNAVVPPAPIFGVYGQRSLYRYPHHYLPRYHGRPLVQPGYLDSPYFEPERHTRHRRHRGFGRYHRYFDRHHARPYFGGSSLFFRYRH